MLFGRHHTRRPAVRSTAQHRSGACSGRKLHRPLHRPTAAGKLGIVTADNVTARSDMLGYHFIPGQRQHGGAYGPRRRPAVKHLLSTPGRGLPLRRA